MSSLFGPQADNCSPSWANRMIRGCSTQSSFLAHWMVPNLLKTIVLCLCVSGAWLLKRRRDKGVGRFSGASSITGLARDEHNDPDDADKASGQAADAIETDPGLLRKHSTWESYTVPNTPFTYPSIRTFYRPHAQYEKLPLTPTPIPLLVFVHGLGGSVAQYISLLSSLVNIAPCLAIDFPGCGRSAARPSTWDAYTTDALARLLAVAIERYRDAERGQKIVFVGHSMGCSVSALLTSSTSPFANLLSEHVLAFVAVCPKASPPNAREVGKFRRLLKIPTPIFDLFRRWDQRGGMESVSVARFAGPGADAETKRLQLRFNQQSRTAVWRRMARGTFPDYSSDTAKGGLPGREVWSGVQVPLFLVAGESDRVTSPVEVEKIAGFLGKTVPKILSKGDSDVIADSAAPVDSSLSHVESQKNSQNSCPDDENKAEAAPIATTSQIPVRRDSKHINDSSQTSRITLKTTILPSPAAHALLYAPTTSRTLSGLIQSFLAAHADERLSLGWQLQHLSTEGKWDVKNLAKWRDVDPVSGPIGGLFRAMKTLREVDDEHCPPRFVHDWGSKIGAVVDISHEAPVYNPKGLEEGGVEYHKFPTVSKLPPTIDEVEAFVKLIDRIRGEWSSSAPSCEDGGKSAPTQVPEQSLQKEEREKFIAVHCHYGFNRTGFFIVSYLVERMGYALQDAIDEFRSARPPRGIRHEHFIDTLFVRYCSGLKRAPTL